MASGANAAEGGPTGLRATVDFCVQQIERIVRDIGPRPSASDAELAAQRELSKLLVPLADDVRLEPFRVSPRAFMGFIPISGALLLAAVSLQLAGAALAALACVLLSLGLFVAKLVFYRPLLDPLFPKATSHNLVATIQPEGPVRRILLFGGHTDSAWEWRWHYRGRAALLVIAGGTVLGSLVGVCAALSALISPGSGAATMLSWVFAAFAPLFGLVMFFTDFGRVSPGANDNLTGVLMSIGLARLLHERGEQLEGTEIRILNTGSEECGVRGARAYVREHREELKRTESLYVALDTFRDLDHMAIYDRDRTASLRHDPRAAALLEEAGRRAGFQLPRRTLPLGASDAIAFTEAGIPAIAFIAMDPAPPRWYHTRLDQPELLEPGCIEAGLRVMLELIDLVDEPAA